MIENRNRIETLLSILNEADPAPWDPYDPGDGTVRLYANSTEDEDGDTPDAVSILHVVESVSPTGTGAYMDKANGTLAALAPEVTEDLVSLLIGLESWRSEVRDTARIHQDRGEDDLATMYLSVAERIGRFLF